jgi:hypothetical protein
VKRGGRRLRARLTPETKLQLTQAYSYCHWPPTKSLVSDNENARGVWSLAAVPDRVRRS